MQRTNLTLLACCHEPPHTAEARHPWKAVWNASKKERKEKEKETTKQPSLLNHNYHNHPHSTTTISNIYTNPLRYLLSTPQLTNPSTWKRTSRRHRGPSLICTTQFYQNAISMPDLISSWWWCVQDWVFVVTAWGATHNATHKSKVPHRIRKHSPFVTHLSFPQHKPPISPPCSIHLNTPYTSTFYAPKTPVPLRDAFPQLSNKQGTAPTLTPSLEYLGSVELGNSFHSGGLHLPILIKSLQTAPLSSITNVPPSWKIIFFISEVYFSKF